MISWHEMSTLSLSLRLLTMCTRHFGSMVTQAIRTHKTDDFPLFLIVMGRRASNEVLNVIQGERGAREKQGRPVPSEELRLLSHRCRPRLELCGTLEKPPVYFWLPTSLSLLQKLAVIFRSGGWGIHGRYLSSGVRETALELLRGV